VAVSQTGVHLRETRSRAREIKFLVSNAMAPRIQEWMRANLAADEFGTGPYSDQYATSSLYFESATFDVFHRRGSYGRSKYRIRRYGFSDVMFLERKFRTERLLAKRRTIVPVTEFDHLDAPDPNPEWAGFWFHRRIKLRRLVPLVQLSYDRTARLGQSETGPVRMTIDFNLRVLPMPDRAFLPGTGFPLIEGSNIVEVKYRIALPALFKGLVAEFGLRPQPLSKYRSGLAALGLTPETSHV
jgi:hypothetical protein